MKLHLPKMLYAALMLLFVPSVHAAIQSTELTTSISVGNNQYWNVGAMDVNYYMDEQYASFNTSTNANAVDYVLDDSIIKAFVLDGEDRLGFIQSSETDSGTAYTLYTGFGAYTYESPTSVSVVNYLKVTGTLVVEGNAKLHIRGQYTRGSSISKTSVYAGVIADQIIVGGSASFTADRVEVGDLRVDGGAISLHGYNNNGNSGPYFSGMRDTKMVRISNSLKQSAGLLDIGDSGEAPHTSTKGVLYYSNYFKGSIAQTGGNTNVYGHTYFDGKQITLTQNGDGAIKFRDRIYMNSSNSVLEIQQGITESDAVTDADEEADDSTLVIGAVYGKSCTIKVTQGGAGAITLAHGTSFTSTSSVDITQTGSGIITIGGGHGISKTDLSGFLNHAMTTYSLNQTGTGEIALKGGAVIKASTATVKGKLSIDGTSSLTAAELNLSGMSNISNSGVLAAGAAGPASGSSADVLYVLEGGELNLSDDYGSTTHTGAIKAVQMTGGEINYTDAVVLDSIEVNGGTVNLTDGGANLIIGSLTVADGVTKGICLTADNVATATSAPLTIADSGSWTMGTNSTFALSFTDNYLGAIDSLADATTEAVDFKFTELVATGTVNTDTLATKFELSGMSSRWTLGSAEWTQVSGKTYVSGVLVYDAWIDVDDGGTFADSVEDETTELKTGLSISEKDVTLTGDNKHTLGTKIDGGDTGITVTLGHANALGAGEVSTTGKTTLTTTSKVTADLNVVISNSGALTLDGSYDVGTLADNSRVVIPAGYVAADGDVTTDGNGFRRVEGYTVQVVDNDAANGATLTGGDNLKLKDGTLEGVLDEDTGEVTFGAGVDYSTYRMVEAVEESAQAIIDASVGTNGPQVKKVAMTAGTLKVDASITVDAEDGSTLKMTGNDVTLTGEIDGATTSVQVTGSGSIEGDNSYSGGTVIDGGKLTVASDKALGEGDVVLKNHGTLDLSGKAVSNDINVEGCTLAGAGAYSGIMDVSGNLQLQDATTAAKVVMLGGGTISGAPLTTTALDVQTDGNATVEGDLTINDNGTVTLNNGKVLTVGGSLTLAGSTTLALNCDYAVGTRLLTGTGSLTLNPDSVTLDYDDTTVELERIGNSLVLVSKFKQDKADIAAQGNWGIATASRAFVNTVRGQHSNTGCIANGRGTVWAAAFGAFNDLDGSDINVKGAAVGVDAKVGSCSTVGIALGYTDGEVQPAGMSDVDQEGTYIALYGEHGLKKLSSTSCLSLDWVAAYGNTESDWNGTEWEQDSLQLNTRLNWNKKLTDRLCMSVFGGLEYFTTDSDTVNGVKTGSIQNLRGELGVGARYVAWGAPGVYDGKGGLVSPGCEKLVLHGEVRYMNDMVRSNPVVRMNGLSGSSANPGRQGIGIEAGATYRISDRWSASANYGYNAMEDSREHRVNVGASYTF